MKEGGGQFRVIDQSFERLRHFGIEIVAQEGGIDTWIGGHLLLIEGLNQFQGVVCREGELLVTLHLQRGQVKQARRKFLSLFLANRCHLEVCLSHDVQESLALLLGREFTFRGGEGHASVDRLQFPERFGLEMVNLRLSVDNQGQGRCLYPSDGEHLAVAAIAQGIEASRIHAEQPVANGS